MEIEQLRHFLAAAELENFTRAAAAVGLSQSALSRSIARLEAELGQPVFERQGRRVALTDVGKMLQQRAQRIVALVDDTKAEISDDGETGRIRVAAIPTIAPFFLPDLLRQFAKKFPRAMVTVQEDTTQNLLKLGAQGEIDLVILAMPIHAKYMDIEELFEEELLLVVPLEHRLARKKKVTLADLEPYPFVLLNEAHCLSDNVVSYCQRRSVNPVSMERTNQLATVQELVSLDHGISMIPAMARNVDESERRSYRRVENPRPTRKIAMAWNPYRYQSRLVLNFRQHLREYAKQFRGRPGSRKPLRRGKPSG